MKDIKKAYRITAIIVFNTLLFLVIVNILLYFAIEVIRPVYNKGSLNYGIDLLQQAYPDVPRDELEIMIRETWNFDFIYEPYTQFKFKPFSGKYFNIDENGFRPVENQCDFPLNQEKYNIFIFGGSTTLGVGVSDKDTIPSQIQSLLNSNKKSNKNVCVYNFGRGHYFSSQERILFEKLLSEDKTPDMAIFIDGLNDYYYASAEPAATKKLTDFMNGKTHLPGIIMQLPITKIIRTIFPVKPIEPEKKSDSELIDATDRYFKNMKIISGVGKEFGISTYFVVQPIPTYKYNLSYHLFLSNVEDFENNHINSPRGYEMLEQRYELEYSSKANIIWLADIQEEKTNNLYVDKAHYTKEFSNEVAQHITKKIARKVE